MTREDAIKILDPETSTKALMEILYQHDYMSQAVVDALNLAVLSLMGNPKWIPVMERLPDEDVDVLINSKICGVDIDYYDGESFGNCGVTHWMPLPEPPKEDA